MATLDVGSDVSWSMDDWMKLTGFLLKMVGGSVSLSPEDIIHLANQGLPDVEVMQYTDPLRVVIVLKEN